MVKNKINKFFYSLIFLVLLASIKTVLAGETFNNNLLKIDLHKNSLGGVEVVLFTAKSYKDAVIVNPKSDFEYTILMPETSNSLTEKPSLKFVSNFIKNIEIKTQQYQNNIKGYTKIVIYTYKPVEIKPEVQTLSVADLKMSDGDYKELIAQASKKSIAKPAAKYKTKKINTTTTHAITKSTLKPFTNHKAVSTHTVKKVQPTSKPKVKQKPIVSDAKSSDVQEVRPVYKGSMAPDVINPADVVTPKVVTPQVVNPSKVIPNIEENPQIVTPPKSNSITSKVHKILQLMKENVYIALGLAFVAFISLLLFVRKMTRNIKMNKANFTNHLNDKPEEAIDYTDKINDDMSWKEKFQAYVDAAAPPVDTASQSVSPKEISNQNEITYSNEELDGLFINNVENEKFVSEPAEEVFQKEETENVEIEEEEIVPEIDKVEEINEVSEPYEYYRPAEEATYSNNIDDFFAVEDLDSFDEEKSIEELFGEDEFFAEEIHAIEEEPIKEEVNQVNRVNRVRSFNEQVEAEPKDKLIKSEFIIDDTKGFYLVDYEDSTALVGQIDEEIFVLKRFDRKINAPIKARLSEMNVNSASFMTKVGGFRGLVEVTPDKMNLLIEL